MKLRTNLLFIALGCILFSSCNRNSPKPCFELICESLKQMDQILAGEDVLISNCTDNGMSFSWDFGDGTNSTLNSPHHVWEAPGDYTITLIAENEDASKTLTQDITVSPSLYGEWEGEYTANDEQVSFTFSLVQSAYKIKGDFWTAGPFIQYGGLFGRPNGVLSSNSVISQDSVHLDGSLIYVISFQGTSQSLSMMYKFDGIINNTMDEMEGEIVLVSNYPQGPWHATKK